MKEHKEVSAALRQSEASQRCVIGANRALYHALRRRVRTGELISPYPNLFASQSYWNNLSLEQQSLHIIRALATLHPQWVFAGLSAACIYGYQHSYSLHDGTVFIASSNGTGHHDTKRLQRIYMSNVPKWRCSEILVTSPARTLIDCATISFPYALAIYDSALRAGRVSAMDVTVLMLQTNCDESAVRRLLQYADPLRESGGESWACGCIIELGYAVPQLQETFDNPDNLRMPYRVDFCWKLADGRIIVAEYDGMAKYADTSNPNRASLQAKLNYAYRREQHLANQGVTSIVHLFYEDVIDRVRLGAKLSEAGVPKIR
ncbi:hypothetical protein [Bifidobacterium callitrichidarum]|uniref:CTP synthase n=1 Tax=Bifidobacterium callitrichidarum TaxID=2052941 RepID=A0A2U2NB90_9BIFI|nr:hypothetical protein [Bifidobacterium callitrichidarum]PWG66373.1 hypothetical protein DF196_04160 [Bifidobacterium callitrichidarum]